MSKSISEQVIVLVGASSGMGLATAKEAARRGAKVVLAARNGGDVEKAAEEIRRNGGDAIGVPTDLTDYAQVENLARRTVEQYGRVDTWVTLPGTSVYGMFEEIPMDDVRQTMEVIFFGQLNAARIAVPLLEQTGGALICVGSTLSKRGIPLQTAYCAAKHALKGWIDGYRVELMNRKSNVRLTLVMPSSINTPLFNKAKTLMGVMPMPIAPIYEPELAAKGILRAAEGNERDVFIGGAGKFMDIAERISPKLLDLQQLKMGFSGQKTSWPKTADAPNNLYGAVVDDGGVRGDFTPQAKKRSYYQEMAANPIAFAFGAAALTAVGAVVAGRARDRRLLAGLLIATALGLTGKGAVAAAYRR